MSHIFISYSREDLAFARYLRAMLSQEGFAVWMDEQNLHAGTNWWKEIERNIDTCAAFVVVMSPTADESMYVHNEIHRALNQKKPLFPVLLSGEPFSLLANIQAADMRAGLKARLSPSLVKDLRAVCGVVTERTICFEIVQGNALELACDALVMKVSVGSGGVEWQVARRAAEHGANLDAALQLEDQPGTYELSPTGSFIQPAYGLFIRTVSVYQFRYRETREFAELALNILAQELPEARHIAMTIHGIYTPTMLDEGESLLAQIGGLVDALQRDSAPDGLERITIVEISEDRVQRLRAQVAPFFEEVRYARPASGEEWGYDLTFSRQVEQAAPDAGTEAVKPYALAIMPDDDVLEDIYYYGIQRPVHSQGLLCERIALSEAPKAEEHNLQATLQRAGQASLLVCYLSEPSPLLSLHIGYAWGKGVPVIFVGRAEHATFYDEAVLTYEKIWELEERLGQQLASLDG